MTRAGMIPVTDRRGSVALMTAIMLPVLIMTLSMGIEITYWSVVKLELQRAADAAAWAGAAQDVSTASRSSATGAAAEPTPRVNAAIPNPQAARIRPAPTLIRRPS